MDYLDFLPDYAYDELPESVRVTVDRADYEARRQLTQALSGSAAPEDLPPVLSAAFLAQTQDAKIVEKPRSLLAARYSLLTAAGWLLFLATAAFLFLRPASEKTVYRLLAAEVPPPTVITVTDTVYQTKTVHRTRVLARLDTVYLPAIAPPPRLVYYSDTVYVPMPIAASSAMDSLSGSRSLVGREAVLDLLFTTE